jgi:hypothetical protein
MLPVYFKNKIKIEAGAVQSLAQRLFVPHGWLLIGMDV